VLNEAFLFETPSGRPEEHHEKINATMNRCGLSAFGCKKFDEARNVLPKEKFSIVFCNDTAAVKTTPVAVLSRFAEWDHYIAALRDGPSITSHARLIWPKQNTSRG